MNEFADFLYKLRKEKGITQAELAIELGVTNKAVSKWETGEAMPETSLLLPLSRIFNVTVDELLAGKRSEDNSNNQETESVNAETVQTENQNSQQFNRTDHLFTRGKDEEPKTLLDVICGIACASVFLLGLATYLFLGAFKGMWNPHWVIVPVCALSCGIISLVFSFFNTERCNRKLARGENPYTGAICGIVMLVCIITYLLLGALLNLWHPFWFIVIIGIVACGILGTVGDIFVYKNKTPKS